MHAVMAVGAKEFETQLQPADMMPDLLRQRLGDVEVRRVDGEIERRCHCVSNGEGGMSSTGLGHGVGAGAGSEGRRAMARRSEGWRWLWLKTGRAACRERVGQDGEITEGRGA